MLAEILKAGSLKAHAAAGLFPAQSRGDDIVLHPYEAGKPPLGIVHTLRQQRQGNPDAPCLALADYIVPEDSGVMDYLGLFACTAGVGLENIVEHYCTASIGLTLFLGNDATVDEIINQADSAMYAAKEQGSNKVMVHPA